MTDITSEPNPENATDDEVLAEQAAEAAFEEVYADESGYTPSSLDFDAVQDVGQDARDGLTSASQAAGVSTSELNGATESTAG